jgi:hypothetical protein
MMLTPDRTPQFYLLLALLSFFVSVNSVKGQNPGFTYQGRLTDGGIPANGNYDLQFTLFDSLNGGAQVGATQTIPTVVVSAGSFTVQLDFGANAFPGANRWLEMGARLSGVGSFITLTPRQQITSSPYAIRSISSSEADTATNATQLGGVAATNYVQTTDSRLSDARTPVSGSASYIQNGTSLQAASNFNVSGNGTLSSMNLNGPISFAGGSALPAATGQGRIFFDVSTNKFKVSENGSPFVNLIGANGVTGSGTTNTIPVWTSGTTIGNSVITQSINGVQLPNGVQLAVGAQGNALAFGSPNGETGLSIAGPNGRADLRFDGSVVKLVARPAGTGPPPPTNGIAITTDGRVGIGTITPTAALHAVGFGFDDGVDGSSNAGNGVFGISSNGRGVYGVASGNQAGVEGFNNGGNGFGVFSSGFLGTNRLGAASFPNTALCLNGSNQISACASSLRYKTDLVSYDGSLVLINRLRPITFNWKNGGPRDLGLGAEEVAEVEPLLVTHNDKGEVEGVKYDRLSVLFINAFKEQQKQLQDQAQRIAAQQTQLNQQQQQLDALRKLVCQSKPQTAACQE